MMWDCTLGDAPHRDEACSWIRMSCHDTMKSRDMCTCQASRMSFFLKPVSPETQATNGHFQNYQK